MRRVQPEKYYEACITYNIVTEFKKNGIRVYPYSISQREEHNKGFDYGYYFNDKSFLVQYKSPFPFKEVQHEKNIFRWEIDREQLTTLNQNNKEIPTYYALPAFDDIKDWYDGIDKTFFIDSVHLESLLTKQTKKNIIRSDCKELKKWDFILKRLIRANLSYAINAVERDVIFDMKVDIPSGLWLYYVEV